MVKTINQNFYLRTLHNIMQKIFLAIPFSIKYIKLNSFWLILNDTYP